MKNLRPDSIVQSIHRIVAAITGYLAKSRGYISDRSQFDDRTDRNVMGAKSPLMSSSDMHPCDGNVGRICQLRPAGADWIELGATAIDVVFNPALTPQTGARSASSATSPSGECAKVWSVITPIPAASAP